MSNPSQHTGWSDEAVEVLRAFAESFHITVVDNTYQDVTLHLDAPHSLSIRLRNDSTKSWIFKDLETRRRTALTAASSIAPATGFEVKALEWVDMGEGPRCITICGMYAISPSSGAYGRPTLTLTGMPGDLFGKFDTLDQAKARAQADFDQRIKSSLVPKP